MGVFGSILNGLLSTIGMEIRRTGTNVAQRSSMAGSYALLKELGFYPKTVIDVGVAKGTPELYEAFSSSYFMLVEALPNFEEDLKAILKTHQGSYELAAAGASEGEITFNMHEYHLEGSSIMKETMGEEADGRQVKVPVITLNSLVAKRKLEPPFLLKIDVQGAELEVLKGAGNILKDTQAIMLEVSLFEFMKDGPQLYDVVSTMKSYGFVVYDIIHGWNRPLDDALGQVDMLFVQENGVFRKDHSYSSVEHLSQM